MSDRGAVTRLLVEWSEGNGSALDRLIPLVYDDLRHIAVSRMAREGRAKVLLQPTALIHEAYLALVNVAAAPSSREHFFALATTVMRHILIDHAKSRARGKRGGGEVPLTLEDTRAIGQSISLQENLRLLEVALARFKARDPKRAQVFELYFFCGLNIREIASELDRPISTVGRQLAFARAWIQSQLGRPQQ